MRAAWWLSMIVVLAGCRKGSGEACEGADDCKTGLTCAGWTPQHTSQLGACAGVRCCVDDAQRQQVDAARAEVRRQRAKECPTLIAAINREQVAVKQHQGNDPADLRLLANKLARVAEAIGTLPLEEAGLKAFRDEYASMARDLEQAAKAMADAVGKDDPHAMANAARTMRASGPREDALIAKLNSYCAPDDAAAKPVAPEPASTESAAP